MDHTLPPGVVCDGCNNYFARKVEDPFLNSEMLREVRALEGIPNKRGLHVSVERLVFPGLPVRITGAGSRQLLLDLTEEGGHWFGDRPEGVLRFLVGAPPPENVVSRFVAKAGLEALALRSLRAGIPTDEIVDHVGLDPVRDWARRGDPRTRWPVHLRRIYEMNHARPDADGRHWQTLHEFDLLYTDGGELYYVLAIFGIELVVNLGGPELDGYREWLREHEGVSPLYWDKNASA